MDDYIIREDAFLALTGDITDCTIEEFIARLRDKLSKLPSVGKDINVTTNEDCISRQAVIEIAVETGAWETQSRVMDLPTVTPKKKTGWIPVSERLPKLDEDVLVCVTYEDYEPKIYTGYLSKKIYEKEHYKAWMTQCRGEVSFPIVHDVVAWMPLPEPYKPQESEE